MTTRIRSCPGQHSRACLLILLTGILAVAPGPLRAGNWPGWRGPGGDGIAPDKNLPLRWSTNENVRWHVELPGRGNSSPILWGHHLFVSQAVPGENRRTVMCFDRSSGKMLWQSGVTYMEKEPTQRENPYCAATPVTDGERVIASFGSAGLYCFDFEGKELWHRDLGRMNHMFGNAASPILHGDLCLLNFGPDEKARLVAVNKRTGQVVWEVQPPKVEESERAAAGGGRGGFGPGSMLAPLMVSQGDKNDDKTLSRQEFLDLADSWFAKLDRDQAGKLSRETFTARFTEVVPSPGGGPPGGGAPGEGDRPGGRRGGFDPGRSIAPGLFAAADSDKDGSVTKDEFRNTFAKWFGEWDADHKSALDETKLRDGLTAALPRPAMGGPGGPGGPGGGRGGGGGPGGSWSTPVVVRTGQREELIVNFPFRLAAYDPISGQPLWTSKGLGGTIYTTPVWGQGMVVAISSGMGGGNAVALRPGGQGDVTESQRVWRLDRVKSGIGSGVIHEGYFYLLSQDGIAVCLEMKTGQTVWEERLKGTGSRNGSWSSMLLADGKIYVPNQSGDVFVLKAAPKFEVLAINSVGEPTNASLAASDGELFLRTDKGLWSFAAKK